ncbi:MAG: YkgJ family cysteine cluster protein [Planctomycetes bacterium]|nr:YkgJ family cysteine cluster protein [Planctomycetota bacterium]
MSTSRSSRKPSGKAPWYKDGLRFSCKQCGACCSGKPGYVWVNDAEITGIAARLGLSREDFRDKYLKLTYRGYSLTEKANYDCILLENGKCLVYDIRPRQCRTWPFWPENLRSRGHWDEEARGCPGMNEGMHFPLSEIEDILAGRSETVG